MKYTDAQIEALIKGIEDGSITELNLPEGYYRAVADYLKRAVFEGFNASLKTVAEVDRVVLEELVTNVYMFGAAKTFQQTQAISSLLVDEDGVLRSSREFRDIARATYDNWNTAWGETEYITAVGQADMAAKWQEIERQKDIMPNLRYSAVIDPNTSEICAPLDGITAPVGDPIWDRAAPLNHFRCRCTLLQVDSEATAGNAAIVDKVLPEMQDVFKHNAGKTGLVFPKEHPYFDVAEQYRDFARANFNLPLPKFDKND